MSTADTGVVRRRGLLLDRTFSRMWAGSLSASLSEGIRIVCVPLSVTAVSTDPAWITGVVAAGYVPLVLGLPLSVVVHRVSLVSLLALANVTRLATYLALILLPTSLPLFVLYAFVLAVGQVGYEQGQQRLVPAVVPPDRLVTVNGLLSSGDTAARLLVGPALGGVLFTVSDNAAFWVAAACVVLSTGMFATVRVVRTESAEPRASRMWPRLVSGIRLMWHYPTLRAQVVQMAFWNFSIGAVLGILPLWALHVLHLGPIGYSLLAVGSAVGGIAGALVASRVRAHVGTSWSVKIGILGLATTFGAIATVTDPVVAGVLFGVNGSFATLWTVVCMSTRQLHVPPALLGRVQGALQTFGRSPLALGALFGGTLVTWFGLRGPFAMAGIVFFGLALTFVWLSDRQLEQDATALSQEVG